MKRLILRIAALGTVVVLGLIAIAQAQRGVKDASPQETAASHADAETDTGAPRPIVPPTDAHPLRKSDGLVSGGNPLRSQPVPESRVVRASEPDAETPPGADIPQMGPDPFTAQMDRQLQATDPPVAERDYSANNVRSQSPALREDDRYAMVSHEQPVPDSSPSLDPPAGLLGPPPTNGASDDRYADRPANEPGRFPESPLARPTARNTSDDLTARAAADDFPQPTRAGLARTLPSASDFPQGTDYSEETSTRADGFLRSAEQDRDGRPAADAVGSGRPGNHQLEGPQSPQLTVEKKAPNEVQVGKAAKCSVIVRNTGNVAAEDVEIRDQVPQGTRLLGTTPEARLEADGELVWRLGTMKPDAEVTVEMELMPTEEGELGSVARVLFSAAATARSVSTKPELVVRTSAPSKALIGEELTLEIEVSNPGTGVATGVVLEEHIPAGLEHPGGTDLEYEVGDLPPGQSRKLELTLHAKKPGPMTNVLSARGDASLSAEHRLNLEVISPELDVAVVGPKRRYLERQAVYQLSVHNPGTAPAEDVELVAHLPAGMKFVQANNAGYYEETSRTVHWQLEQLPVNETGTVELVALPIEAGEQTIHLKGTAAKGLVAEQKQPVMVEGIAAIMFTVADTNDPIEIGGETTYEIRVVNQGSKAATNLRVAVLMPPEMRPVAADGPTRNSVEGSRVLFDGLSRLAPKADTTYRVRAKGVQPGDLRLRVQLLTDEMRTPVTKEVSTRVYTDE